jgi:hypothetical protein
MLIPLCHSIHDYEPASLRVEAHLEVSLNLKADIAYLRVVSEKNKYT